MSNGMIYNDLSWGLLVQRASEFGTIGERGIYPRLTRYGSLAADRFGLLPSTELVKPIPQADWKDYIAHCHDEKIFPMYHRKASSLEQKPSQNGTNFCWAWSARAALENARLLAGMPAKQLAPVSLAWLVRYRNQGNYLDVTIKGLRERGVTSEEFCPSQYDYTGRSFKTGWEADAMNYRLGECWDTNRNAGLFDYIGQCLAILGTGTSGYIAYDWWSHALVIEGMEWDESQKHNVVWDVFNSHGDGSINLAGDKGVPDEFYGLRIPTLPGQLTP